MNGEADRLVRRLAHALDGPAAVVVVEAGDAPADVNADAEAIVVLHPSGAVEDQAALETRWTLPGVTVAWRGRVGREPAAVLILAPEGGRAHALLAGGAQGLLLDESVTAVDAAPTLEGLRVAVITYELLGVALPGGIGTAYAALAQTLAGAGAEVDLLFTGYQAEHDVELLAGWSERHAAGRVNVEALDRHGSRGVLQPYWDVRRAYAAHRWLAERHRERRYHAVHVPESRGHGACIVAAKRAGLAYGDTTIVTTAHGTRRWLFEASGEPFVGPWDHVLDHLEHVNARFTDVMVGPSAFLLEVMRETGFALPERTFVQQNLRAGTAIEPREREVAERPVDRLVFFGRLDHAKGLDVFADAVEELAGERTERSLEITFMGREVEIEGMTSRAWIERRTADWPYAVTVITDFDQPRAIAYLRDHACVPVMPSPLENSPMTVLEALALQAPFVAAATGGTAELIDPRDHGRTLVDFGAPIPSMPGFAPREERARSLAAGLRRVLADDGPPARYAVQPAANLEAHVRWHAALATAAPAAEAAPVDASVTAGTVGVVRYGGDARVRGLAEALRAAAGTYVLVLRDNHRLRPGAVETLAAVAARTDEPLVAFAVAAAGDGAPVVPPGGPAEAGVLHDVFTAGSVLVRTSALVGIAALDRPAPDDAALYEAVLMELALAGTLPLVVPEILADEERPAFDAIVRAEGARVPPYGTTWGRLRSPVAGLDEHVGDPAAHLPTLSRALYAANAELALDAEKNAARVWELDAMWKDAARVVGERDAELQRIAADLARDQDGSRRQLEELQRRKAVRAALKVTNAIGRVRSAPRRAVSRARAETSAMALTRRGLRLEMAPELGSAWWERRIAWRLRRGRRLVFVDCGGHNGSSVRKFRRDFDPEGRFEVTTFEPNPAYAEAFAGFERHELVQAAVGDHDGVAPFYLDREDGDGSTLYRDKLTRGEGGFGELDRDDPLEVRLVDLSGWLRANVRRGDYLILKLDVEGAEYAILPKLLADGTLRLVDELFIEWHWDRVGVAREEHDRIQDELRLAGVRVTPWDAQWTPP